MKISAGKLWGYKRLADENGFYKMVAVDQRPPIMNVIKKNKNVQEASYEDVAQVKVSLTKMLSPYSSAMLVDPIWTYPNVHNILDPKKGLILTLEEHKFIENDQGRLSSEIVD
jgi:tagatose 1,6-diphosphate aldolase